MYVTINGKSVWRVDENRTNYKTNCTFYWHGPYLPISGTGRRSGSGTSIVIAKSEEGKGCRRDKGGKWELVNDWERKREREREREKCNEGIGMC